MDLENKRVRIYLKDGIELEGIILSRPKLYSPSFLTLKLPNGYNIGIPKESIAKIDVLQSLPKPKETKLLEKEEGEITIIATGGTIMSKVDYTTGGVVPSYSIQDLLEKFPQLREVSTFKLKAPFSYYSEEFEDSLWIKLAREIHEELLENREGVIVFHGTDTMHYSSSIISFMIQKNPSPIIFTGAQRSSDRPSSDTFTNIYASALIIKKTNLAEVGICMHETLSDDVVYFLRGVRTRKMHSTRRDAFKPVNDKPLARVFIKTGEVKIVGRALFTKSKEEPILYDKLEKNVYLIYYYPGMEEELIEFAANRAKAIILMGTGMGHISVVRRNYTAILKKAIREGVDVYMTTQTIYGTTNPRVYSTARVLEREVGVVYLKDMLPEVAYTKAKWAYANFDNLKEVMLKNVRGEISERRVW
jgi:glutamyl-tRNA(Gln) amidotransferase subunit D